MKPHPSLSNAANRRGVALIIVLSMLVLMSAVLVAFMGSVSTERTAQRAAYSGFEAQQAAESAVNLVISQIRAATTSLREGEGWASQPGVIRTFKNNSKDGKVYKLYSAERMQDSQTGYRPDSVEESGIDSSLQGDTPAEMVDLNTPVITPGREPNTLEPHYPIVDPRAALDRDGRRTGSKVEGFWTPLSTSLRHISGANDTKRIPIQNLPMRVRWLYQLKDGTLVAADRSGRRIPGATKDNPPVARVAFWTDDESGKINVNTAGENTYWDTPFASNYSESGAAPTPDVDYGRGESAALSASQPAGGEYQRYPGHPATTNLSPALRWLYPRSMKDSQFKEAIYRLTPRYRGGRGTTMGASRALDPTYAGYKEDHRVAKRDRLFATLDEFWFRPDRSPISVAGFMDVYGGFNSKLPVVPDPDTVEMTSTTNPLITPQALEQLRFFLTASSRAPELNLFGKPRVCIWPVHEYDNDNPKQSKRSGYDDLMAFASTVGGKPYYFTRGDPWSPTYDLEESGLIAANNNPDEVSYRGRNKRLLFSGSGNGYLQRLGKMPIPGEGGTFAAKYSTPNPLSSNYTEFERILLTIFDYIRCTNLIDTGRKDLTNPGYQFAYTPGYNASQNYSKGAIPVMGSGQVTPSVVYGDTGDPIMKGFGRYINFSEVGLLFYQDSNQIPSAGDPNPSQGEIGMRCVLLPETWTVSGYYPGMSEGYAYKVTETTPFMVGSLTGPKTALQLATGAVNFVDINPWMIEYGRFWMPTRGFNNQFWTNRTSKRAKTFVKGTGTDGWANYPFFSRKFYLPAATTQFTLEAGTLEFEIYPLNVSQAQITNPPAQPLAGKVIQRMAISFPSMTLPVPPAGLPPFQARIASEASDGGRGWINQNDVIRTMEINGDWSKGDFRHIAGITQINKQDSPMYWGPSGVAVDEYKKNIAQVHNFRSGWGRGFRNAQWAKLTQGATTRGNYTGPPQFDEKMSKVPGRNGSAVLQDGTTGDFDRGISKHIDGPMINKPDEGNVRFDLSDSSDGGYLPYFRGGGGYEEVGTTFFTPNRIISSPIMFGSLPSGIFAKRPWETLQFCPPTSERHKGVESPKDHYLLDWFQMPVVEPYAISEPLSTMGKINLNSRIAPFGYVKVNDPSTGTKRSYIQRHTGIWGVLKRMKQFALADGTSNGSHQEGPLNDGSTRSRWEVDPGAFTDQILDPALDARGYFMSATEICELDIPLNNSVNDPYYKGTKWKPRYNDISGRKAFWEQNDMTGDNCRERIYSHIYPRLTTKSNVYTVHVWSQSIAKSPSTKADEWDRFDETKDRILGEYRGSTTIERYIDVHEQALRNYDAVDQVEAGPLDPYYRFRIVNQKRFNPQ